MFEVFGLFFILAILTVNNYIINGKMYISPAVVLSGVFCFSSFWLFLYAEKWDVNLNLNTVGVIIGGILTFSIVCKMINIFFLKKYQFRKKENKGLTEIKIDDLKLNVFIIFALLIIILTLYYTIKLVNGSWKNIGSALYTYRHLTAYKGIDLGMPKIIDIFGGILNASSYWFIYVLINNYFVNKKINIRHLIIIILSITSSMLDGSRGGLINNILACIPMIYILKTKYYGKSPKLYVKTVIYIVLLAAILLSTLKLSGTLLGRNNIDSIDTVDYIAMYAGAQINNLDVFLQENSIMEKHIGLHTFKEIYSLIGNMFQTSFNRNIEPIYRSVNDYNLGNVYTIFFDFICDLGYPGVFIYTTIMAIISQVVFEISQLVVLNKNGVKIIIIAYTYMFGGIIFAFFGNKFFPQIVSTGFVKYLVLWYLYNYFFCKLKIKY